MQSKRNRRFVHGSFVAALILFATPLRAQTLFIRNGNVVDVVNGRVLPHRDVVISAGKIVSVGRSKPRAGVKIIDASGRYIVPGFWDMHVHADEAALRALMRYGITSARDMGNSDVAEVLALRQLSLNDTTVPHLFIAGPKLSGTDFPSVDSLHALGVDFVKVHEGVPRRKYFEVMARAKQLGYDVVGHVPEELTPAEASSAGQRSIEHLEFMPDACLPLFSGAAANSLPAQCSDASLDSLFTLFARNKTWLDPTISSFRLWVKAGFPTLFKEFARITQMLRRHGIRFLTGTDIGTAGLEPGASLHDELELLVKAGYSPAEVLRAGTIDAAEFMHRSKTMGSITPGKVADVVILDANPLADIRATRRISMVIKAAGQ